mmetsp:Transcript_9380/g.16618  ORF Transcript_9380/g.16618 Transcript_9380/m.16618 type:complete len:485 (+) Transcript_9380:110-1564(+)
MSSRNPPEQYEDEEEEKPKPVDPELSDGRRPALYQPTLEELEAKNQRKLALDDETFENKLLVTFVRINPFNKEKVGNVGSWGASESESSILGPAGPSYVGKVYRNPISNQVQLKHEGRNIYDFHAVDLWSREHISAPLDKLRKDRYLFRAYPMQYRTWLYHEMHRSNRHPDSADETAQLRKVLSLIVIDAPVSAARWSPFMLMVPSLFFVAMMNDEQLSPIALIFAIIMQRLSTRYNTTDGYKEIRFLLLIPRLVWVLFVLIRALFWLSNATPLQVVGLIGCLLCHFLDFWYGDKEVINNYKLNCHYEIIKQLPNRAFIVRRRGAADTEHRFGFRGVVHQNVAGSGKWGTDMLLIVEVMGCLFELRPFTSSDWEKVQEMYMQDENCRLTYWGLDCYHKDMPSFNVLERKRQVNAAAIASKAGSRVTEEADPEILLKQLAETKALLARGASKFEDNASDNMDDSPPPTPDSGGPKAPKSKPPLLT